MSEPRPHDLLARRLMLLGLNELAKEVAAGKYHDFLSPYPLPELRLVNELARFATALPDKATEIMAVRKDIVEGKYDATKEESDEWAASPEGQETFRRLTGDK
jgi:hypothetical protein